MRGRTRHGWGIVQGMRPALKWSISVIADELTCATEKSYLRGVTITFL